MPGRSTRRSTKKSASSANSKRGSARKRKRSPAAEDEENAASRLGEQDEPATDPAPAAKRRKRAPGDNAVALEAVERKEAHKVRDYSKVRLPIVLTAIDGKPIVNPYCICGTDDGNIACCDNNGVRVFTREGVVIRETPVKRAPHLILPSVASLPGGRLVSAAENELKIIEADGTERLISDWAPAGSDLRNPAFIPTTGNIVVGDAKLRSHALYIVSQAGELLRTIPQKALPAIAVTTDGTIVVHGLVDSTLLHFYTADGDALPDLAPTNFQPWGLAADHNGNIVGATTSDHVVVIQRDGTELYRAGGKGASKGKFKGIRAVGVLPDGTILACDARGDCVKLL